MRKYFAENKHFIKLLALFLVLLVWRASGVARIPFLSDHIGNFIFTGLAFLIILDAKIYKINATRKGVLFVSLLLVALNIVIELFVNVGDISIGLGVIFTSFNVADPLDIPFGILAVIFLLCDWRIYRKSR